MVAKRSSRALAVLLALPSAAFALGLGDIRLLSPLNAPLDAEIDLVDVTPDEMNSLQVQLASRDTFAQNGLEYPNYLSGVKVKTQRTADGREVIKLKSNDVISDPFLTLLVEVNWARGRLVREYTVLLDPPVYAPSQQVASAPPVAAPTTGAGAREGTIARNATPPAPVAAPAESAVAMSAASAAAPPPLAPPPAPAASEPAPAAAAIPPEPAPSTATAAAAMPAESAPSGAKAAAATAAAAELASATAAAATPATSPGMAQPAPSAAEPTAAAPEPGPSAASAPATAPAAAATGEGDSSSHLVRRGETLSKIAAGVAGESANSARARSWMLAIYEANPRAFERNMNLLRSGAVLRMPDAASVAAVSPSEASAEIRRQYNEWHGTAASRGEAASAPSEATAAAQQPGRLKLVTPSESASVGTTPGAKSGEVAALQGRVHDLEGQLSESKRLLALKDADLARLQSQLAAKQAQPPAPAPEAAAPPAAAPPPAATPAPAEQPPVVQSAPAPAPAPAVEEKPQPQVETPPVATKRPAPAAHKPEAPAASGGLLDTLLGYWWVLLVALLGVGAIFGLRMLKARRAAQFDDSLDRLAGAGNDEGPDLGNLGSTGTFRGFGPGEPSISGARAKSTAQPEGAFLVEETGSHERPRLTPGAAAQAPAPRHIASDETISSETAINLDQGDPLAEADFHMAYGLYDQAADLIRIAISREPTRRDLKLKLLEVFFVWGNKDQFLQTARELADTRAEAAPGEWEKILIMGKQLAPEDPLFSGGGAVTGAAAGGVDLDLEGGQSRVDFDLLGEPAAGGAPHDVDLDIGTAVSEGLASDSTTGATDRNAALLENSFVAATGTTRQMTARVRQGGTGTAEMEAPTVEQPALVVRDNPTIRAKLETAMRKSGSDQTAELAIDDLGLDVGSVDTVDQPGPAAAASSTPDAPTLVAGLDDHSRKVMEDAHQRAKEETGSTTGAWQFDQNELEAALTQTSAAIPSPSSTSRLAALRGRGIDVDVGDITGTHAATATDVDVDVGTATGTHSTNGSGLDLDVGTATVPDAAFAATQRLTSDELALPDLEPVTMSEVGTKLDLARAYMDMGDPDGARNILEEVLHEGSAAQKQEAQRLMESLP